MNDNEKLTNEKEEVIEEKRPLGERIEDGVEEFFETTQDAIYGGPGDDPRNDIPSTIRKPNGVRKINKVQTRKNINRKLFGNKTFLKVILIILGLGIFGSIIISIINLIMVN